MARKAYSKHQDPYDLLADAGEEIEKLTKLVEEAYKEGFENGGESFGMDNVTWGNSDAKKTLEEMIHG